MRRIYLIIYLFCLTTLSLQAIEGLKFENITHKEGLSHNTVRCVMQDSRGFIWISTINGLNRYDGHKFINMYSGFENRSLTENNIRQTKEDHNGRIWVHSSSRFVNCFDTNTESFVDYTGKNETRNYRKIKTMPDGDVWLWGIENGACHIRYTDEKQIPTLYDINNIGTNIVAFVLKDSSGQVWMGTDKGLLQLVNNIPKFCNTGNQTYNYHSAIELDERILFFTHNNLILVFDKLRKVFLPPIELSEWKISKINHTFALDKNRILISGKQATLLLNVNTSKVSHTKELFNGQALEGTNIHIDNQRNCWVYNRSGNLWRYQKETHTFKQIRVIPESILAVIDLERFDVFCDSRGITWITTYGNGLFTIEETGQISHFTVNNSGLKTNYLLSVSEDRAGDIWIGTENAGISKISLTKYNNQVFLPDPDKNADSDRIIRSIYEDKKNGDLWVGTKSGDVYQLEKDLKQKNLFSLKQGVPYSIASDTLGNTWIGTKGNGLLVIPKGKRMLQEAYYHLLSDDPETGASNIYAILRDQKGRMWIGTFGSGLFLYELKNGKFQTTTFPVFTQKQKQIRCMIQDNSGMIWAGGENGIVIFHPDSLLADDSSFEWLHFEKNNPQSLNNNIVKTLLEDKQQRVWIGTSGGGLNLAVRSPFEKEITLKHYTTEEGLINNMVQAILEDDYNNLWISTESGISKFNPANTLFENYNFPDAWESDLFCESSAFKRTNGELLFGSYNGMYIIDPSSFESRTSALPVTLTGLSINGIPVSPNSPDSPLSESIRQTSDIRLKNGQNSFSIEFSSLNFRSTQSNRYTYILENYDKEWNPVTQYNVATYKNIPTGKYVFKVKNVNNPYASEDVETTLYLTVVPPFWKSPTALLLYIVFCFVAGLFAVKLVVKMNKLHNQVEVEKQLTEYRLRFFTNISHEFRTPLTIIRGSIESMSKQTPFPATFKKHIETLDKSSSKLMRLIDQLLEFRKMQNNQMSLRLEQTEVVGFLYGIYDLFSETAARKQINFTFTSDEEQQTILLDRGKIEKVLFNLLSNAFKHTPENGSIAVEITFRETDGYMVLQVSDSGIGIPADKQDLLFVRFKQINYSSSGIGIGLHLASEFTNIHKGEIKYHESRWKGACFTVSIPTNPDVYDETDIVDSHPAPIDNAIIVNAEPNSSDAAVGNSTTTSTSTYKILLIEDDEEIRLFLEDQLKESFTVFTASNGRIGWESAINEQPNLIVCDVMMPEMDGFEVTRKLKADFQTSHIPIILLTAHSSIEHQLEGINAGADAYIIKPFSTEYLILRIVKLIEQREKLQYKFAHEPGTILTTICTTDKDNEFIAKIHAIIEKHIDNPDFSIDDFAQAAHMGRTIFYKKIKGITNYSPNEYLRILRLKKAAELLKTTSQNVSEIAYKVGFNDPDYFSKCFKEQFGMRPTQFRNGEN